MTEELDVGCSGIIVTPPGLPPGVQGGDGKRGSIVVNPDIHEPLFLDDVIDTIGNRLHDATLFDRIGLSEVIDIYLCVFTVGAPFLSSILHIPYLFGLLRIYVHT